VGKHSFPFGVFTVGRFKSGPRKGDVFVRDVATGQFVKTRPTVEVPEPPGKRVLSEVFGRKWRCATLSDSTKSRGRESEIDIGVCKRASERQIKRDLIELYEDKVSAYDREWMEDYWLDSRGVEYMIKIDERPEKKGEEWVYFTHHGKKVVDYKG